MREPGETYPLKLVADLHLTVAGERGDATAHLHGWTDELVVDIDHPEIMLRQLPVRGRPPLSGLVRQVLADTPIRVRSGERNLARLRLTAAGKVRVRPTLAGVATVVRALWSAVTVRPGVRGRPG